MKNLIKTSILSFLALTLASGCTIHRINEPGRDSSVNLNCKIQVDDDGYAIVDKKGNVAKLCSDTATGAAGSKAVASIKESEAKTEAQKAGYEAYAKHLGRKHGVKTNGYIRVNTNKPEKKSALDNFSKTTDSGN